MNFYRRILCASHVLRSLFSTDLSQNFSWVIALLCATFVSLPVSASNQTADICKSAAQFASSRTGVPVSVLRAISLTETGRKSGGSFEPWPWTVNMEGKGVWFDTREEARSYVNQNFERGARSFDVGCFQLNYKWHGQAFASIEEMFDPAANALYAAGFLRDLFVEKGSWTEAAGAYHSRTPKYANRYKTRFERILASITTTSPAQPAPAGPVPAAEPAIDAAPQIVVRLNRFPLLQGGSSESASLGSLMPASAGAGFQRLIGGG